LHCAGALPSRQAGRRLDTALGAVLHGSARQVPGRGQRRDAGRTASSALGYEDLSGQTTCARIRCLRGWPPGSNQEDCAPVAGKRSIVWSTGRSETVRSTARSTASASGGRARRSLCDQIRARRVDFTGAQAARGEGIATELCRGSAGCAAPGQATRQFRDLRQQGSLAGAASAAAPTTPGATSSPLRIGSARCV
jgi:hypothetical protein